MKWTKSFIRCLSIKCLLWPRLHLWSRFVVPPPSPVRVPRTLVWAVQIPQRWSTVRVPPRPEEGPWVTTPFRRYVNKRTSSLWRTLGWHTVRDRDRGPRVVTSSVWDRRTSDTRHEGTVRVPFGGGSSCTPGPDPFTRPSSLSGVCRSSSVYIGLVKHTFVGLVKLFFTTRASNKV